MNNILCIFVEPNRPAYVKVVHYDGDIGNSFEALKKALNIEMADFVDFPPIPSKFTCLIDDEGMLNHKDVNLFGVSGAMAVLRHDKNPECGYVGLTKDEAIEVMAKINRHLPSELLDGNRRT
jgi:hypothetical protein